MLRYALLIIDSFNDNTDPHGSTYVPGADQDILKLSQWINRYSDNITKVFCSIGNNDINSINYPKYWLKGNKGKEDPRPFMNITFDDVDKAVITTRDPKKLMWAKTYLQYLKSVGRGHMIWPYQSIDGYWGQALPLCLSEVFNRKNIAPIIIRKNENPDCPLTGLFESSFPVAIPGIDYPENKAIMKPLMRYDKILIAGFHKDICVADTVASLITNYPKDIREKLVFLRDAMRPINPNNESLKIFDYCVRNLGATDCLMNDYEFE